MGIGAFLGREPAVAELSAAADGATAGRGRLVLVAGEAGIGKTALAAELAGHAVERGMQVRWATCWDGDGAPAYWPWVQVLREHAAAHGPLVPELARLVPGLTGPAAGPAGEPLTPALGEAGAQRFQLFDAVASTLLGAARDRPLLVVLDDLHWADVPSLLLLDFLAPRLLTAPMVVLGLFRDEEVRADPQRRAALAEVRRHALLVALSGLAETDVARLMATMTGGSPGAELAAAVFRRTAGNPFFVREVTQLLESRGSLADPGGWDGGIPEGVRQVVRQRLARLPQACVSVLTVAAAAGRETGTDLLARATGSEVGAVVDRLDEAVRAGVLARPPSPAGPYRFVHDLFRETLYDALTPPARAEVHLALGEALEGAGTSPAEGQPAELAHHFLLAAVGHRAAPALAGRAVRHCLAAAAEAVGRLAYEDAVGHYRRTLDGLGLAGILPERDRLDLLLGRADALRRAGEASAARRDYDQATELARGLGRPAGLARAALGVHALGVESGAPRDECIDLLSEALDGFDERDSAVKARLLAGLARELYLARVEDRPRAARLSAAAVDIARRVGDDATLAACLLGAHDILWLPGTAARRRAIAAEMGTVARRAGDRAFEAEACLLRASAGLELADPGAFVDLEEFAGLGTAVGQQHYTYLVLTRRAMRATMAGRFADTERLLAQAAALAEATGEPDAWNVQNRLLWDLRSAQGRRGELPPQLRDSFPLLRYWYEALEGLALVERGERAEALRAIGPAVQARPEDLPFPYVVAAQWAELGEAAAAAGMAEACQRYYDALRPHAGTAIVVAAAVGFTGAVDHHLGTLAAALGRPDRAAAHLADAIVLHERLSAWPWLARSRCELAAVLAARGRPADRDRAAGLLAEVRQAADELGMPGLLARAARVTLGPESVFRRDGDGWLISYAGRQTRLRDTKGLADIAALLRAEGREVPATLLAGAPAPGPGGLAPGGLAPGGLTPGGLTPGGLAPGGSGPDGLAPGGFGADPVLDGRAQREYRSRLAQLDEELDRAERDHDRGRAQAAADERAALLRELAAAVGLGQRARGLGDDRERARKAVTARIKDALRRIEADHPALGAHLGESIATGNFCSYRPPQPVHWRS